MNLFGSRTHREFHHEYIYYDERKKRLSEIEERAKRELGLIPPKEFQPQDLKGAFLRGTKYLRKRKEKERDGRKSVGVGMLILLIVILSVLWYYLIY
jgi:hypothetical protein